MPGIETPDEIIRDAMEVVAQQSDDEAALVRDALDLSPEELQKLLDSENGSASLAAIGAVTAIGVSAVLGPMAQVKASALPSSERTAYTAPRVPGQRTLDVVEQREVVPSGDTITAEADKAHADGVPGSQAKIIKEIEHVDGITDPNTQWRAGATEKVPRVVADKHHDKHGTETVHPAAGEGLVEIAADHHTTLAKEEKLNPNLERGWHQWGLIYPNDDVKVPVSSGTQHTYKKIEYDVKWGDTSIGITEKFHEQMKQFVRDNADKLHGKPGMIYAGEELLVREEVRTHHSDPKKHIHEVKVGIEVKSGDTVSSILERYGIEPSEKNIALFAHHNGIDNPNFIKPGQHFWLLAKEQVVKALHHNNHPKAAPHTATIEHAHSSHHKQSHQTFKHDKSGYDAHDKRLKGVPVTKHGGITPEDVHKILPEAPMSRIRRYLPMIIGAEHEEGIDSPKMVAYLFATFNPEDPTLKMIPEYGGGYQYQGRADLGDTKPGYGHKYEGRGPSQITGFYNYEHAEQALHIPLVEHPGLALKPKNAFRIAALFEEEHKQHISDDLDAGNMAGARADWNGGENGEEPFVAAMHVATEVIPQNQDGPVAVHVAPTPPTTPAPETSPDQSNTTELAMAQEAITQYHLWRANNFNAPGGQSGPNMYVSVPGEAENTYWCDILMHWLEGKADAPVSSDPIADERVSATWQHAENGDQGYTAYQVGHQPVVGEMVVHAYNGDGKPSHINIIAKIVGNRMLLIGGDQTHPGDSEYTTPERAAVTAYWVDIPTADGPNSDSIVGYIAAPAPEAPPTTTPPSPSPIATTPPTSTPTTPPTTSTPPTQPTTTTAPSTNPTTATTVPSAPNTAPTDPSDSATPAPTASAPLGQLALATQ